MKASPLAKNYKALTPEERFRLILAASGRGDEAERDRLAHAGEQIALSFQDHAPYTQAFGDLAMLIFIELLEEAASYQEAFAIANDNCGTDEDEEESDGTDQEMEAPDNDCPVQEDVSKEPVCMRALDLALASGYMLRTKANGWKLFCERLNLPPFLLWEDLPGFIRVQRALALAEKAAFAPEGFLAWLNRLRPKGEPELTTVPMTVEGVADETEKAFRWRVQWWRG